MVVVDDGSTDDTAQVARAAGATCLTSESNCGKGAALRKGVAYAHAEDFTHVITVDGDGQHMAADLPALIDVSRKTGADMVIGARPFDRALMPRARFYSKTRVGSRLTSAMVGREILDSQCGLRMLRLDKLSKLKLRSQRYEFEMEVLIKMARSGCTIAHAPIHMVYDNGHARSKMKPIRDTVRICLCAFAFRFLGA